MVMASIIKSIFVCRYHRQRLPGEHLKKTQRGSAIFIAPRVSDFPVRASFLWLCSLAALQQGFQSAETRILRPRLRPTESETLEGSTEIYILNIFRKTS